jgi:hypothetical protein
MAEIPNQNQKKKKTFNIFKDPAWDKWSKGRVLTIKKFWT